MTEQSLSQRFHALESHIAAEKGAFAFFALFLREDAPDRWDLIVAAPWIGSDEQAAVDYFVDQIKARLGAQNLISLSRIIVADPHHLAVQALNREIQVEHGEIEIRDRTLFGQPVKRAIIITSKLAPAPAAA